MARVVLTGHWGDQCSSVRYLVDLFRRLAWREIRRHRRIRPLVWRRRNAGASRRFVVDVARHHLPRALVPPFKWIRRRLLGAERPKPWFSDAFLRRALRFAGRPATIGSGFHSAQARSLYLESRSKYHVHCLEWHNKIGAMYALDTAFPVLDRDLLGFLMAIPGEVQNLNGVPRALLRESMRGVLPERIRARTGRPISATSSTVVWQRMLGAISQALSSESLGVQLDT
jgi:asparagine synthase (glutamine-hydrolysing)